MTIITDQITSLCTQFKLPTVATEAAHCFQKARHEDALESLLEVLEMEAEDRRQRRTVRLRHASKLPAGKIIPPNLMSNLKNS